MTNADVIKMVKAGLSDSLIILSIRQASRKSFTLSADGLVELKSSGVSDPVIRFMLDPTAPPEFELRAAPQPASAPAAAAAAPVAAAPSRGPTVTGAELLLPHEEGVYVMRDGKLEQLEPAVVTAGGVGGGSMLMSSLTMGIKKVKLKAEIRGGAANLRVGAQPEFYFYGAAFNPNRFIIGVLEPGETNRKISIGEAGLTGAKTGIRDKDQVAFTAQKLASNIYKVVVPQAMAQGEYAWADMSDTKTTKIWDFALDPVSAGGLPKP